MISLYRAALLRVRAPGRAGSYDRRNGSAQRQPAWVGRAARLGPAIGFVCFLTACGPLVGPCPNHVIEGDSGVPASEPIRWKATACLNGACSEATVDSDMPTLLEGSIAGQFTASTTALQDWMRPGMWYFTAHIAVSEEPSKGAEVTLELHDADADKPLVWLRASGAADQDLEDDDGSCLYVTARLNP